MTTNPLMEITPQAAQKLEEVLREQTDVSLLRIIAMSDHNGGIQYIFGAEEEAGQQDLVIKTDTIDVLVDAESAHLVKGAQIDYVEGHMHSGFVIRNPNSQGGCACGGRSGNCGGH